MKVLSGSSTVRQEHVTVGLEVGVSVGETVGGKLGDGVGTTEGMALGEGLGIELGLLEGIGVVGRFVGLGDGKLEGN